jgi:hypothetical protein
MRKNASQTGRLGVFLRSWRRDFFRDLRSLEQERGFRQTRKLPVDQVLKSLALRWHFPFLEQELHLRLPNFIGGSHLNLR